MIVPANTCIMIILAITENELGHVFVVPNLDTLQIDDTAREIGALDLVITTLIEKYAKSKTWFDFGKSTEGDGTVLNEGLITQKEGFGGRTNVYMTWGMKI